MLLALWLPAMQHCNLEAAGLFAAEAGQRETTACCDTAERCLHDGCDLAENGLTKTASASFKLRAPDLSTCVCILCMQLTLPASLDESASRQSSESHPSDWLPTWQFVRRAALPARAPNFVA